MSFEFSTMRLAELLLRDFVRSSSATPARVTSEGDINIYLDSNEIEDGLPGWKKMTEKVEVEFLKRDINDDPVLSSSHWAFLLKGKLFFCTIEYGDGGIVIKYYKRKRGIETACAGIMGNVNCVYYSNKCHTTMNFAEILQLVDTMKTSWRAANYSSISHNCQHFVQVLGREILNDFNELDYAQAVVLPSQILIKGITSNMKFKRRHL
jgi:hypothetical protein